MSDGDWKLENELRFVSSIGSCTDLVEREKYTRRQLLEGYAKGLAKRNDGYFTSREMVAIRERVHVELASDMHVELANAPQ